MRIPPLRERRGDVALLFAHFLRGAAERFGREAPAMSAEVRGHLLGHDWPGNVRELRHFADRFALGLAPEAEGVGETPASLPPGEGTLADRVDRYEADLIRRALADHRGDVRATVEALGVPRKTFYDKLKRHGIRRGDFEPPE